MKPRYRLNTDGSISIIALSPEYAAQLRRQRRAYLSPVRTKTTKAMHPEEIKAEMRMKGVTPAMLCDELNISAPAMSQVITGRAKSKRIQTRISEIIGKPISEIWSVQPSLHCARTQKHLSPARNKSTSAIHPEEIKAALRIKGITLTAIARELGLSRSMVTHVIYGNERSQRVEKRIAQVIGKPVSAIWANHRPRLRQASAQIKEGATA